MLRFGACLLLLWSCLAPIAHGKELGTITVKFDFSAAEAMLEALAKPELSDADIERLLRVRGVRAMVVNTIKYFPTNSEAGFRTDMQSFVGTRKYPTGDYALDWINHYRAQVVDLIAALRRDERAIASQVVADLARYQPNTGNLDITVYFVAGGVSDGFVLDNDTEPAFFVALEKASGDVAGVQQNVTHELYHVAQKAAGRRVAELKRMVDDPASLPVAERLLLITLWEGTANYAADASKATAKGPYISMWRDRYVRNADAARIRENFALFDKVLADVLAQKIAWTDVDKTGFSGNSDARFYFVGYEMAKAIEHYSGAERIGRLFEQRPAAFFKEYIALTRAHPELKTRFAPATEAYIASLP